MSINLLELMQSAIGNKLVERAAGIIGEDAGGAQKAVGAMLPSLLGGLIGKSSTPEGADLVAGVLGQADGTIVDNIDKIFDGADGGSDRLLEMGQGLASGLLGDKLGGVLDIISKSSGIGGGGTGKLMNLLLPLVFSVLGKQTSSLGLNPAGIAKLLGDQSGFLKGLLPKGMSGLLGLPGEFEAGDGIIDSAASAISGVAGDAKDAVAGVGDTVGGVASDAKDAVTGAASDAKHAVTGAAGAVGDGISNAADKTSQMASSAADATADTVKKSGGFIKLLIPIIILGLLAFLAWKFLAGGGLKGGPSVAPAVSEIKTENALDSMKGVLNETTSTFNGIKDEATAKAALPKIEGLTGKIDAINGMASKLPAGMSDSIGAAIKGNVGKIQSSVEKAYAIPGVEGIIGPKVEGLISALNKFGQ